MPGFLQQLRAIQSENASVLCVGLDPDPRRIPSHLLDRLPLAAAVVAFNAAVVDATASFACAYKLNFAFYEALGREGWEALKKTVDNIPGEHVVVADAKRGDIGNSARFYADAIFSELDFDACTVTPYMGRDAVEPFLRYEGKATFVLGRTSNPGAADFQECDCGGMPLYLRICRHVRAWNEELPGTAGLVVGATRPEALAEIRSACPTLPFLIPGVGAQGGDPQAVMQSAATEDGTVLVNSSRSIIFASGGEDFAEAAAREAKALRDALST